MQQAMKDKMAQHEAEQKQKEHAETNPQTSKKNQDDDFEEEDPDFMDDANEREIMRRMALERMGQANMSQKSKDRNTEGVGKT